MKKSTDFEQRMQCLIGTFAIENMSIAPHVLSAIQQLDAGETSCQQLVEAAKLRHSRKATRDVL